MDQFSTPSSECKIEIKRVYISQDECSEQRGIDEIAGVWVQETSAPTSPHPPRYPVQFVHFKCTQRRSEEVAASFDRINLSHNCEGSPLLDRLTRTRACSNLTDFHIYLYLNCVGSFRLVLHCSCVLNR